MAKPVIVKCPTKRTVQCGSAFTIALQIGTFDPSTNLTVCGLLPDGGCTFAGGSRRACQNHPGLPPGLHSISLNLTINCPSGETYLVLLEIEACNQNGECDSRIVRVTINC